MPIKPENRARYPADWKLRSRFVRLVRARGRCEWCGAVNGQPHPVTGSKVVLTTAHVHDHRPEAASLLNLAALCQRCHLNHDKLLHQQNANATRRARASSAVSACGEEGSGRARKSAVKPASTKQEISKEPV